MAQVAVAEPVTTNIPSVSSPKMSYEEFLEWADEDTWAEWVDGEVFEMSPASASHQDVKGFLAAVMRAFVEAHGLGKVFDAPFQMKTGPDLPGREPDVLFIASEHLGLLKSAHLAGAADLVVEIISTESRSRDRGPKFYEYEEGGVREYWLIDPDRKRAQFHHRDPEGLFRLAPVGDDGIYHSSVLEGLWLQVEWLWQQPLPKLIQVQKEWGLV